MAADQPRSVAQKMGVKAGVLSLILGAPRDVLLSIQLPRLEVVTQPVGNLLFVLLFTKSQEELNARFASIKPHLAAKGSLWVSWPKGRGLGSDLTLPEVIRIGYPHGLVESKSISIDCVWSSLKFTHPKPGKKYNNSFGTLPEYLQ